MNDFDFQPEDEFDFQLDFQPDQPKKRKTTVKEDLSIGFNQLKNTVDTAWSMLAGGAATLFGQEDDAAEIYQGTQKRIDERNARAPQDAEQNFAGKIISALPQIPAFPLSPFETGKTAIDRGESATNAAKAVGIDTLGNLAGVALPGAIGGSRLTRAASGALINAGQDFATRKGIQSVVETPEAKEAFKPTAETMALSGVMGGGFAALAKPKQKPKELPKLDLSPIAQAVKEVKQTSKVDINLDEGPNLPPVMRVTPEGQAFNAADAAYKDIADAQMAHGQRAMDSATANMSKDTPPDSSPIEGYQETPNKWVQWDWNAVDENGMPVRNLRPTDPEAPDISLWNRQGPARNDLRMAMEEANGPILGPGENGSQSLSGPMGAPEVPKPGPMSRGMGRGQRGAIDVEAISEAWKRFRSKWPQKDTIQTPTSPESIEAKRQKVSKAKAIGAALGEWANPSTPEEALHLAQEAKDIPITRVGRFEGHIGKHIAPGNNFMAAYHNNPMLKYMRKLVNDARGEATKASKEFLTGQEGVSTLVTKLRPDERIRIAELVGELDKQEVDYTPELADKIGLTPSERRFMESYQRLTEKLWDWGKQVKDSQGVITGPKRKGYAASVFRGDYNALVTHEGKVVGVIAVDTPAEFKLAKKYYEQTYKGSKFSAETYQKAKNNIAGTTQQKAFRYNDLGAMIDLLKNADGDLAKAQLKIDQEILRATTDLYGLNVHDLAKKGISGNQGNKPWLDRAENAQQRLDAIVRNSEDRFEYLSLQKANEELNQLVADPRVDHLPNTKDYMNTYWNNVTGRHLNIAGTIGNNLFKAATYISEMAGVSPTKAIEYSNFVKNKMSQLYMGWYNMAFLFSQFMQPAQTGLPMMQLAAGRLGLGQADVASALTKAADQFLRSKINSLGVDQIDIDPRTQAVLEWAQNRGIMDFSELERVYEGHKSDLNRKIDRAAEWNMQIGESWTRPPMFLAFVNLLSKTEPDLNKVLPIAENLTNQAMVDYHKWERPLMYTGMGVLSPHAGGLTTFKHSYLGTQALLGKEALKGNSKPALASIAAMTMLAGLTGLPFYDEIDNIYQWAKDKMGLEAGSIAQDALTDLPQWAKTGLLSSAIDLNIQGKFSSANMVPDTPWEGLFPHLSGAYDIAKSGAEFLSNPNDNTFGNLATTASPSTTKQLARDVFKRDGDWMLDKYGQNDVSRTPEQWDMSSLTGLTPLQEAVDKRELFQNRKNEQMRMDKMKQVSESFKDAVIQDDAERITDLLNEYTDLGGDASQLLTQMAKIKIEAGKDSKQRAEGVPSSRQGIMRYEAYN